MLDLKKFSKKQTAVVPIVNNFSILNSRKLYFSNIPDGFYEIEIQDSDIKILDNLPYFNLNSPVISGYLFDDILIPVSWNTLKLKYFFNPGITFKVALLPITPSWEIIDVFYYADDFYIFKSLNYTIDRKVLLSLKEAFEKDLDISFLKGLTPELRYFYFLHYFRKQEILEAERIAKLKLAEEERKRYLQELSKTFPVSLKLALEKVGARLISYSKVKNNLYEVYWQISNQNFNSLIRSDLSVFEAGVCLSQDDKRHNITSLALTCADYIQRDVLYKTR